MREKNGKTIHILFLTLGLLFSLCACSGRPQAQGGTEDGEEGLTVHFIDVGQADSALLECDGQAMLIDGGNVEDSSLLTSYLDGLGVERLDYVVCTHAHEDHVGGLSGPLNSCTVGAVLAPVTEYGSTAFSNFAKYTAKQGLEIVIPRPDEVFALGGAQVTVLGPRREYEETNNTSIVLRVDYGEVSFLFTGDMERAAEEDLLADGCDLEVDVLKVGHHGSDTSTGYPFLREVSPAYGVISVGTGNSYGHPDKEIMGRLYDAGATVYRTDEQGTVVVYTDGETLAFSTEKDVPPTAGREEAENAVYIGNRNSHVFHRDTCTGLPAEKNQVIFNSREEAEQAGYAPCSRCAP